MKLSFTVLLLLVAFVCLSQNMTQQAQLEVKFEPSFIPKSHLIITAKQLIFEFTNRQKVNETRVIRLKKPLDSLQLFLNTYSFAHKNSTEITWERRKVEPLDSSWVNRLEKIGYLTKIGKDSVLIKNISAGKDGISVKGTYITDQEKKDFSFWSPQKGTQNLELVKRLIKVLNQLLKDNSSITYLEDLEGFFDVGLGLKRVSGNPMIWKLYGHIYVSDDNTFVLENFFQSLPKNKIIYIDVSNFYGMGTLYYPFFKEKMAKYPLLYFLKPSPSAMNELKEMNVSKDKIIYQVK